MNLRSLAGPAVLLAAAILIVTSPLPCPAAELSGVTVPDSVTIGGTQARLAGMGIRKKFIIKVYVASLYMAEPELAADAIIHSDQARAMRMDFLYKKVGADSLREAWTAGFDANTPDASNDLKERMERFTALFAEDALAGDVYMMTYEPGAGTTVSLKGKDAATIPGADFAEALFAIWFGDQPADKGLKKNVLKGLD